MANISIDSLEDPRLAPYRNIRHRDPTDHNDRPGQINRFIAEGRLVVERLLESRYRCESLLVERNHHADLVTAALSKDETTDVLQLDLSLLRQLVGFDFHRGILACGQCPMLPSLDQLKATPSTDPAEAPLLVVIGVNNPENVGGLMRTAAAFGVSRMGISKDVANPFSRRALRVSMAAALKLEIFRIEDEVAAIRRLALEQGYRTCATALTKGAKTLAEFSQQLHRTSPEHRQPLAIVVGSEADGLSDGVRAVATDLVTIPMHLGTDSLNVNVATAIFLYELTKYSREPV